MNLDPVAQAQSNPYFERHYTGRIKCSLCGVVCTEEANFLTHIQGKRHTLQLELIQQHAQKRARIEKEEQITKAAQERMAAKQAGAALLASRPIAAFGRPTYRIQTEPDAALGQCKVWLEFDFQSVSDERRPLHRWRGAREQEIEKPDDAWTYLLVACEGYDTVALKFPAALPHTNEPDIEAGRYKCSWDPLAKKYSLFLVIG